MAAAVLLTVSCTPTADTDLGCLTGAYLITEFTGTGVNGQPTTGRGGNIGVIFRGTKFQLSSDGRQPMTLTSQGETAELALNGATAGTIEGSGSAWTFTLGDSIGTARLRQGTEQRTLDVTPVARVLLPEGAVTATCQGESLTLANPVTTVRLQR